MFKPKYVKTGEMLSKGVQRFINYRRDMLPAESLEKIETQLAEFRDSLKDRDEKAAEKHSTALHRLCEGAAPNYRTSAIGENIEVIFVAIAIALGIRAFFLQPFRIPTGSMQPTLNGILAYPTPDKSAPNPIIKTFDQVIRGRAWVDVVARKDDSIRSVTEATRLKFFTFTTVETASGEKYTLHAPRDHAMELGLRDIINQGGTFNEGDVLARGYVDTGDQVLVDKMSYHFIPPIRGEVFVFTTNGIRGIEAGLDPRYGSQHYIKRLAGVPGDELIINTPEIFVNGERGQERGFQKVMSQEGDYRGYLGERQRFRQFDVPPESYVALGDNSHNSSDSREWGFVPEPNLVGRALFVYWPFTSHWGVIR